ncbi:MAG: hypothetical protein M3442_14160, partial [Chloroflexota bacterium]|nr:hypothetical protein [Chloroflexota bacterium]
MTTTGCIQPGMVTAESIVAFVDGDATPDVARHLRACPACAAEAQVYTRLQRQLTGALYRFDCPPTQTLGEYELDVVTPESRTTIARHLLDCPLCMTELMSVRAFLAEDGARFPVPGAGLVDGLRRLVATLFVPTAGARAIALRGSSDGQATTYRVEDFTITLGPGPQAHRGRASLMGLVVRESDDLDVNAESAARLVDDTGEGER